MRDARAIYGAPPPPRHEPCIACGKPTYNKRVCLPCEVVAGSMEALGLAIQRFVRRAEVEELAEAVRTSVAFIAADAVCGAMGEPRKRPDIDGGAMFRTALARLVEMAKEPGRG